MVAEQTVASSISQWAKHSALVVEEVVGRKGGRGEGRLHGGAGSAHSLASRRAYFSNCVCISVM